MLFNGADAVLRDGREECSTRAGRTWRQGLARSGSGGNRPPPTLIRTPAQSAEKYFIWPTRDAKKFVLLLKLKSM